MAKEHEDFDDRILLAKEFTRLSLDPRTDPAILMEIEKRLEKLGVSNNRIIDSFANIIPNDFEDLRPFLSQKTIDFFMSRNREKREGAAKVDEKLNEWYKGAGKQWRKS